MCKCNDSVVSVVWQKNCNGAVLQIRRGSRDNLLIISHIFPY